MYQQAAELYRALGEPVRLRILALLRRREACVCELVAILPISQPAVSQHLRRLPQADLVRERRQKYWTYDAIREDRPPLVREIVASLPGDPDGEAWLRSHEIGTACNRAPRRAEPAIEVGEDVVRGG